MLLVMQPKQFLWWSINVLLKQPAPAPAPAPGQSNGQGQDRQGLFTLKARLAGSNATAHAIGASDWDSIMDLPRFPERPRCPIFCSSDCCHPDRPHPNRHFLVLFSFCHTGLVWHFDTSPSALKRAYRAAYPGRADTRFYPTHPSCLVSAKHTNHQCNPRLFSFFVKSPIRAALLHLLVPHHSPTLTVLNQPLISHHFTFAFFSRLLT